MGDNCDVYDMLRFRDKKAEIQRHLLNDAQESSVISFGLNIPGPIKTGELIHCAFDEGKQCIEAYLNEKQYEILDKISLDEKAGYATVYLVKAEPYLLKKELVYIEDHHALGRLFDIDVLSYEGTAISREQVGASVRKCLLCAQDAKVCARSRRHSIEELNGKIIEIIEAWRQEDDIRRQSI